jgi:hypothetical protein
MLKNTVVYVPICKLLSGLKIKTLRAEKHLLDGKSTWNCCCMLVLTMTSPIIMRNQHNVIYMLPTLHMT